MKRLLLLFPLLFVSLPSFACFVWDREHCVPNYQETEMIYAHDLKRMVIVPQLAAMEELWPGANHPAAANLLVGTLYQESTVGDYTHLRQLGNGPALGPYQIEPDTHIDRYVSYLAYRPKHIAFVTARLSREELSDVDRRFLVAGPSAGTDFDYYRERLQDIAASPGLDAALVSNLAYATVVARIVYYTRRFSWPEDPGDVQALGKIWDDTYNLNPDHGTPAEFIEKFPREIL